MKRKRYLVVCAALSLAVASLFVVGRPTEATLPPGVAPALLPLEAGVGVGTLGGTLAVSDDGAASYSIRLDAPVGRAGIEPALSLTYSSRGGNGMAGVGWSLGGLSQISRCGRNFFHDGEARPVQFGAKDNFCLDGAVLIRVSRDTDTVTAAECTRTPRQEYRTDPDSFLRVIACGSDAAGPIEWVVYDKDGRIRRYGGDDLNARLDVDVHVPDNHGNPGTATVKRRPAWLLARVQDRAGNYMTYGYGRTPTSTADQLESWPVRIDYTGFGAQVPQRSVVFTMEPRTDRATSYLGGIEMPRSKRLKSVSMHAPNAPDESLPQVRKYDLIYAQSGATKRSLLSQVKVCDGLGVCLPATSFFYSSSARSFTASKAGTAPPPLRVERLSGTDVTGDGKDDLVYTDHNGTSYIDYVRIAGGTQASPSYGAAVLTSPAIDQQNTARVPYDMDDDGRVDLVSHACTRWDKPEIVDRECVERSLMIYPADGAGHFLGGSATAGTPICDVTWSTCVAGLDAMADMNGDLAGDPISENDVMLDLYVDGGRPRSLDNPFGRAWASGAPSRLIDIDGDRAVDLLWPYCYNNSNTRFDALHVRGTGASATVEATPLDFEFPGDACKTVDNCQVFADVNGDGLTDAVDVRGEAKVRFNRGNGRFNTPVNWSVGTFQGTPVCANYLVPANPWLGWANTAVFPVDYDLDGRQDLLVLQPTTDNSSAETAKVLVARGTAFEVVPLSIPLACASKTSAPRATTLDANGDGLFDVVFVCPSSATESSPYFQLYTQNGTGVPGGVSDVLTTVSDGLGAMRGVGYQLLTDPAVYTRTTPFIQPMLVVWSESIDDGNGNQIVVARHTYEGGTTTGDAEGWLGFRRHTITDPRNGAKRRVTYTSDGTTDEVAVGTYLGGRKFHPYQGRILEDISWVTVGSVVRATRTKYVPAAKAEVFPNGASSYFTYTASETTQHFETAVSSFTPDAPGISNYAQTVTKTDVNICGDPTMTTSEHTGGVKTTIARVYTSSSSTAYCNLGPTWIDFLSTESVRSDEGGLGAVRETKFVAEPDGTGRVRDTIRQPHGTADEKRCTRVYHRNSFGMPDVIDATGGDCARVTTGANATRTIELTYDAEGIYVRQTKNPLGHVTTEEVHPGLGVSYESVDANGQKVRRRFDGFGRLVRTDFPDGSGLYPSKNFVTVAYAAPGTSLPGSLCNTGAFTPAFFAMVEHSKGSDGAESVVCRDRLARVVRSGFKPMFGTAWSFVDATYDAAPFATPPHDRFPERVLQVTRPYAAGSPAPIAARYAYDDAGRVTSVCHSKQGAPNDVTACVTTSYTKLQTDTCDERGVHRRQVMTPYGTVASTSIFPDATSCTGGTERKTTFAYGPFDTLIKITDAAANVVTQEFDPLGRRKKLVDGDIGTVETTYTAFDEVRTDKDAKGQTATMTYDRLGRLISRAAPDGTDGFTWDPANGKGLLGSSTRGSVVRTIAYDALARPSASTLRVDGTTYATDFSYDEWSRVATTTLPNIVGLGRLEVRNQYGVTGRLLRMELKKGGAWSEIWKATAVDSEDRIIGETFGNGVTGSRAYTNGFLTSIVTSGGPKAGTVTNGRWQNDEYVTFENGSLKTRTDKILGVTETFAYDGADRLVSAQVTGKPAATWQYDAIGNLTFASDVSMAAGCAGGTTLEYKKTTAIGAVGPHALTRATCGVYTADLRYDANGNTINGLDGGDGFTWNSFDKLDTTASPIDTWQLTYDASHERVFKKKTAGISPYYPWTSIVYAGPLERRIAASTEEDILQIPVGSATLELIWSWNGTTGTQKLHYLHPDRLGSPEVVMDSAGALVEKRSFDAWGRMRGSSMTGDPPAPTATLTSFTGHHEDLGTRIGDGFGFIDMGGRIYNPLFKRFWSPDPFVQAPDYGPSWNRYAYAMNNPVKFIDPTGYLMTESEKAGGLIAMGFIGYTSEFLADLTWERQFGELAALIRGNQSVTVVFADGKRAIVQRKNIELVRRAAAMWAALQHDGATTPAGGAQSGGMGEFVAAVGEGLDEPASMCPPNACIAQATPFDYEMRRAYAQQKLAVAAIGKVKVGLDVSSEFLCARLNIAGCGDQAAHIQKLVDQGVNEDEARFIGIAGFLIQFIPAEGAAFGGLKSVKKMGGGRGKRDFSDMDRLIGWEMSKGPDGRARCLYCWIRMVLEAGRKNSYHADHFVAWARGGLSNLKNLIPVCARCNLSKGSKRFWDWIRGQKDHR